MAVTEGVFAVLKEMAFGAGVSGLKVIGSLAFPGAWPIIEGALDPVLDRLKEKLETADPLDAEHAEAAWSELQKDGALAAIFEARLRTEIEPLRASQEELSEGQRRLVQLLDGNASVLGVIKDDLDRMRTHGVTVGNPSIEAIQAAVGREFAERMRILELRLEQVVVRRDGADAQRQEAIRKRFRDQLARTQVRAVELLNGDEFDRAADELRAGLSSLELLIEEAPDNIDLRVNLGYYYKTIAATFASVEEAHLPASIDRAKVVDEFNERALSVFYFVVHGIPLDRKTARDHAHALNGMGNIHFARSEYHSALEDHDLASRIDSYYCYAWHDKFVVHHALAGLGQVDFPAMRHALDKTWETGQGQPGLGRKALKRLEQMISTYDPAVIVDRLIEEGTRQFSELAKVAQARTARPDRAARPQDDEIKTAVRAAKRGAVEVARPALERIIRDHDDGVTTDPCRAAVAKRYLGSIVARSDLAAAHKLYAEAAALDPDDADAWHDLGSLETHLGYMQDAARDLLRAAIQARADGNLAFAGQALEHAADALLGDPKGIMRATHLARGLLYFYATTNNDQGLLRVYQKLIATSIAQKDIRQAEHFIKYALDLARKGGHQLDEANLLLSAATISVYKNDADAAIGQVRHAKRILEETGPESLLEQIDQQLEALTQSRAST
jgi:tetratricopeptide (TPR) repeat protein